MSDLGGELGGDLAPAEPQASPYGDGRAAYLEDAARPGAASPADLDEVPDGEVPDGEVPDDGSADIDGVEVGDGWEDLPEGDPADRADPADLRDPVADARGELPLLLSGRERFGGLDDLPVTGEPRVDAATARLEELADLPTGDHVAVYDDVLHRLSEALADADPH